MDRVNVVIVGGGQAGLAVSHELSQAGADHVVLERDRVGHTWRGRWDSFCLVTPNWSLRLPGHHYDGADPDGFLPKHDIVTYLAGYAASFGAPVREGVEVHSVTAAPGDGFLVHTSDGELHTRAVVACTGPYARAHRPPGARSLPVELAQLDVADYRNPGALPPGAVLVVGCGQSGAQLAEELHEAGREVVLACGRAPWAPRRLGGRDIVWWGLESGFLDQPPTTLPSPAARLAANILATGRGGGHDLHLRSGFRPDYGAWLPWPEAFDEFGFPLQQDGASTVVDGLYFAGGHFQRKRMSATLIGVGEDAAIVAAAIAASAR